MEETGFVEVIDGQQRMLTITILMAVIRDLAQELDPDLAARIHRQDIAVEDRSGVQFFRIQCGDSLRPYFEQCVQGRGGAPADSAPNTPEENRVKANYLILRDRVVGELNRFTNKSQKLAYLENLRAKVTALPVIRIDISSEEDAYEIFETTNARGVDLSITDLVKNLIFKKIRKKDDRDLAREIWTEIVRNVEETNTEMKRFIRYFWLSKYSSVSEKKLFREIKKEVSDWDVFLDEIWNASQWYNKLLEVSEDDWKDIKHGVRITRAVTALRLMNVTQCHVLFLSLMRNYDKLGTDPVRVFEVVESFTLNHAAVCKLPANKVEKIYSRCAREIEHCVNNEPPKRVAGEVQSILEKLRRDLVSERPSYELFEQRFMNLSYGLSQQKRQLVKYVLSKINSLGHTGEHKIDFDNVNIEHVLPQTPAKEWHLTRSDVKPYVNKLGNLTLVSKTFNSRVGNKVIKEKKKELVKSEIRMTQELVASLEENGNRWGQDEIEERQRELAGIAYNKVWNF
ncbi:DUF262 domain-containing protein [Pseudomonadota bacterium]